MDGHDDSKPYVEPFVGGGNMISACPAPIRWGNDIAEYAVALLEGISNGWEPPTVLSETEYHQIKEDPHGYDPELVGFAMYSCSYAGKAWGGYWRSTGRNGAAEQVRHLRKQSVGIKNIKWTTLNYRDMQIEYGSTVYCDPPYAGTTDYKTGFSHEDFWNWCDALVGKGCRVFVSEYAAPEHWIPVWEKEVTNSLTKDTGAKRGVEKLFARAA